jgi:hypothetical protein
VVGLCVDATCSLAFVATAYSTFSALLVLREPVIFSALSLVKVEHILGYACPFAIASTMRVLTLKSPPTSVPLFLELGGYRGSLVAEEIRRS